jgi:hypothetical protein
MARWAAAWFGMSACVVSPPPVIGADDTDQPDDTDPVDTIPPGSGADVLILDDGGSGDQVEAALEAAGHNVVARKDYWRWDGTDPRARDVEVVVWLQGVTFADPMQDAADRGLVNFVNNGGGLIRTELASFAAVNADPLQINALLPVSFDDGQFADRDWEVWVRGHDLVQGIPERWTEAGTSAMVRLVGEAEMVMATRDEVPLVSFTKEYGGTVLHINHDMSGTTDTISEEILGLLANAVSFVQ